MLGKHLLCIGGGAARRSRAAPPPGFSRGRHGRPRTPTVQHVFAQDTELAALAAERGTAEDLAEIDWLARQMEVRAAQRIDFVEPDVEFHRRIAQAGYNPILYRMMESVNDLFMESRRITSREPGMTARAVRRHLLIADALSDRNIPPARLLMLAHMNDILSSLVALQSKEPPDGM